MRKQKTCGIVRMIGIAVLVIAMTPVFGKADVPRIPDIISVSEPQILYGNNTSTTLWAKVKGDNGVSRVWAEIYPPDPSAEPSELELKDTGKDGVFKAVYENFTMKGVYYIYIYAADAQGDASSPVLTDVTTEPDEDNYEADNTFRQAKVIVLNSETPQRHNFYQSGDNDWIKFYGVSGQTYVIEADNLSELSDIVVEAYGTNGTISLSPESNNGQTGEDERIELTLTEDTLCHVKFYDKNSAGGKATEYDIQVNLKHAPVVAKFKGTTADAISKSPLGNVMIKTDQSITALSDENAGASYTMYHPISQSLSTAYTLTARLPGYQVFTKPVFTSNICSEGAACFKTSGSTGKRNDPEIVEWDGLIEMIPKGDITGDGKIDLADAVAGLQAAAGAAAPGVIRPDYIASEADVNGDDKVGVEEVIHILNYLLTQ